jgi:hypothetical protein
MSRVSILAKSLLVLGVILVIMAGFSGPDIPTISIWLRNLPYFFLIGGFIFIVLAIVLMLKER